jgi:hypothetical protein
MEIYGNLWKSGVPQLNCGNLWKSMEIYGATDWHLAELWKSMVNCGNLWQSMAIYGDLWQDHNQRGTAPGQ